ncbi:hypothetical protein ACJJIF_10715 [Microbulbifer sp. SSSA002]|uniref:hypothetical protein n=1 Tax=Microbulbifer sp. SSSA002 TaxID=3243376 RepID=UPI00403A170F
MIKLIGMGAVVLVLGGCTSLMEETVSKRAPFDLNCDADSITIQQLGGRTYGVSGCDKRATYVLQGPCTAPGSRCLAVMNSSVDDD